MLVAVDDLGGHGVLQLLLDGAPQVPGAIGPGEGLFHQELYQAVIIGKGDAIVAQGGDQLAQHDLGDLLEVLLGQAVEGDNGVHAVDKLRPQELLQRLQREDIKEVIIATNSTVEGEATALWISKYVKQAGIKVTRIASGVPVGGALEFIDEMTLFRALEGRTEL